MLDPPMLMGPFISWIAGHCTMLSIINDRITYIYSLELNLDKQEQFIKEYKVGFEQYPLVLFSMADGLVLQLLS